MKLDDRIHRANAGSRRVPPLLFRVLLAWVLSAIALAILVPALHARGVALQGWMPWALILAAMILCVGPDLVGRWKGRD